MGRRLYVGNLPYSASEDQLTELFGRAGKVDNVRVMRDMATGRARGFAFVEMASDEDAQKAITDFHEHQMEGRALVVNEARPKPEGGFGGAGGGRGRGGLVQLSEQFHDFAALTGVQIARRLVGQNDLRVRDDGPRDGDQLLLAARELIGIEVLLADDRELVEDVADHALAFGLLDVA